MSDNCKSKIKVPFKWHPLETCPEGELVLFWTEGGHIYEDFYQDCGVHDMHPDVTHWAPLPPPPDDKIKGRLNPKS